jgi:ribosomal protein S18 acetylase RimI-like enzyme
MIRPYAEQDFEQVIKILARGSSMSRDEIALYLDWCDVSVYDEEGVKGFTALGEPYATTSDVTLDLWIYVQPEFRGRSVGARLYDTAVKKGREQKATRLSAEYNADDTSRIFFAARGFKRWYSWFRLAYTGPAFPEPDCAIRAYRDEDFLDVLRVRNEAFYELRLGLGLDPLTYTEAAEKNDALRQDFLHGEERLYCCFDGRTMVAFGTTKNSFIPTIAVAREAQGKGYGRALTQYCANRLLESGVPKVRLGVVETNTRARALYESLGFQYEQRLELATLALQH